MQLRKILLVSVIALSAAGAAYATGDKGSDQDRGGDRGHMRQRMAFSVEHAAMHNIMAELLSAKTGRSQEEIRALFENSDPRDAVEKLGLSRDDMRALFQQAHLTLIQKAQSAGLITAEQATKLKAAPFPPERHGGPGGPEGDGPRGGPDGDGPRHGPRE